MWDTSVRWKDQTTNEHTLRQHEDYVANEQWERSGAAQHARTCPVGPAFNDARMLKTEHRHFERSVRESLEIQRHRSAPRYGGMNKDEGQYLKTTFWMPYMDMVSKEERERRQRRTNKQPSTPSEDESDVISQDMTSDGRHYSVEP